MHIYYFTESDSLKQRGNIRKEKDVTKTEPSKRGRPPKKGKPTAEAQHHLVKKPKTKN